MRYLIKKEVFYQNALRKVGEVVEGKDLEEYNTSKLTVFERIGDGVVISAPKANESAALQILRDKAKALNIKGWNLVSESVLVNKIAKAEAAAAKTVAKAEDDGKEAVGEGDTNAEANFGNVPPEGVQS